MTHITFKQTSWVYLSVFLAVVLLHGVGHRYGLPYVENYDEARIFYNAAIQRGAADGQMDLVGYPPMLFWMYGLIQPLGEQISHRPAELDMGVGVGILRALAVLANAASAVLMVWIARRITGRWIVGLLAAAAWAIAPDTLYNTVIALTEPFLILTSLLAFALALHALYSSSRRAALLSVVAALVGVLFKYGAFPALGFGVGVALWQTRQDRRWWGTIFIQCVMIVGTALMLLNVLGAAQLMQNAPEGMTFTQEGGSRLFNGSMWSLVVYTSADQLKISVPIFISALVIGTVAMIRQSLSVRLAWAAIILFVIGLMSFTVAYITYTEGVYRYTAPLSPWVALIISFALWSTTISFSDKYPTFSRIWLLIFGGVALIWFIPVIPTTTSVLADRTRPDTRAALAQWSLPVLTEPYQNILQDSRDNRTFIRDRAGYQGLWYFQKWADPLSKTPEQWVADNTHWLMAEQDTQTWLTSTDDGKAWADKALLLKSFPPEGETWRGPALWFYRLTPPQQRTDIIWNGSVHLVGYDLSSAQAADPASLRPGETFTFTGYWRADSAPTADLRQFIHVRPADDLTQVKTQADGRPVDQRPSTSWTDAQETLIGTPYTVTLPPDLPAGEYVILVGLYDGATGTRWTTSDGQDSWEMMRITIR